MSTDTSYELPPRPYIPPVMAGAGGALASAALVMMQGWRSFSDRCGAGDTAVQEATTTADPAVASLMGDAVVVVAVGAVVGLIVLAVRGLASRRRCGGCEDSGPTTEDGAARRTPAYPVRERVRSAMRFGRGRRHLCSLWQSFVGWALLGMVVGAYAGAYGAAMRAEAFERLQQAQLSCCTYVVVGDPSLSSFGAAQEAEVRSEGGRTLATVRLSTDEPYEDGTVLQIVGRLSPLDADAWGQGRYMAGTVAEVRAASVLAAAQGTRPPIAAVRARMLDIIDPSASDARALIAGIVCGRTTELNAGNASEAFARTGTSHLVAVSGSHLAFVASLARLALSAMGAGERVRSVALLVLMSVYVVFTGGAPSAVRSLIMVGLSLAAGWGERRSHGLSALGLTVMVLVIRDAGVVFDLGFQLSAVSVLFIQLFYGYLSCVGERAGLPRALAEPLALTLCAQWGTLPLTIPVFGECSLIAPVANVVLGPLMSALLVAGLVATPCAALVPALAPALLAVPHLLAAASVFGAELLAQVPYASMAIESTPVRYAWYGAALVVYAIWANVQRWQVLLGGATLALGALALTLRWTVWAPAELVVLDVGQADAILVRDGSSAMLVDAGVDDEVAAALARNHVFRLDAVVITHWDRDHCGGLGDVLEAVPVSHVMVARGAREHMPDEVAELALPEVIELDAGNKITVGGFTGTVVWPRTPVAGEENEDSLALSMHYEEGGRVLDALLTGDTEAPQEEEYASLVGDIDVLKLGHHGSEASVDVEVLEILQPEVAIASAGAGNSYGHPSEACVTTVDQYGAQFFCTIDDGDVGVEPGIDGVVVHTER